MPRYIIGISQFILFLVLVLQSSQATSVTQSDQTKITHNANQDEIENRIINGVITAYGGTQLRNLSGIKTLNKYKQFSYGSAYEPNIADVSLRNAELIVDFKKRRSFLKTWTKNNNGARLGSIYFDGQTGHSINYFRGTHVARPDLNFNSVAMSDIQMLDTTIVKLLAEYRHTVKYLGLTQKQGVDYFQLRFSPQENSRLTLFINSTNYLIDKMARASNLIYLYSGHRLQNGIQYASETTVLSAGKPIRITDSRQIVFNPNIDNIYVKPANISSIEGGMLDTSKMSVKKVSDNAYIVGKGARYSLFVDMGDSWLEAGALAGLKKRLTALKKFTHSDKPLRFQVIAYHGHIGGVSEALELGAKIISVDSHFDYLSESLLHQVNQIDKAGFIMVDSHLTLNDNKIQVYEIDTALAKRSLLVYLPESGIVFGLDHFTTRVKNALPGPGNYSFSFRNALNKLNLSIQFLYDGHTPKPFTFEELSSVANEYRPEDCLPGHEVCDVVKVATKD